jgi:hypothetical protein
MEDRRDPKKDSGYSRETPLGHRKSNSVFSGEMKIEVTGSGTLVTASLPIPSAVTPKDAEPFEASGIRDQSNLCVAEAMRDMPDR